MHAMDEHFRDRSVSRRRPAGSDGPARRLEYIDFFGTATVAVLPYEQYLKPVSRPTCSWLTMESERPSTSRLAGATVDFWTCPRLLGAEPGTNGQHSCPSHQLIHQGTELIPCDFFAFAKSFESARQAPPTISGLAECLRPGRRRLAFGKTKEQVENRGDGAPALVPHRDLRGRSAVGHRPCGDADAGRARQARRPVRSTVSSRRGQSGISTRSINGASESSATEFLH